MATERVNSDEHTKIMLGVNESSIKGYPHPSISSKSAFEWTLNKIIRNNTSGFKLLFLHVQLGYVRDVYGSSEEIRDANREDTIKGSHLLEYFVKRCNELGVACEAWIKKGDPRETICNEVKHIKPDLLVLGNRGIGPIQRLFLRSVSEYCVKNCECPVVTIKRSAAATPVDPIQD